MKINFPLIQKDDMFELEVESSLVIIGLNGSGKTRLGVWLEENNKISHRVSAIKYLDFPALSFVEKVEDAKKNFYFGTLGKSKKKIPKYGRWGEKPATHVLMDFDELLNLLFAYQHERNRIFIEKARSSKNTKLIKSKLEQLIDIWKIVLPNLKLVIEENSIKIIRNGIPYDASEMSDGERQVFYFIGQILCAPECSLVIIDEPEQLLHPSIVSLLWNNLQSVRKDCIFIFLTHDMYFASSRFNAKYIWLQKYIDEKWTYQIIDDFKNLQPQIFLEIIGSQSPYLFIEGTENSIDLSLYEKIYKGFKVVPLGSCQKVIETVRSLRSVPFLSNRKIYGFIDGDFRDDSVKEKYKLQNIFMLDYPEVENLFYVNELLEYTCKQNSRSFDEISSKIYKEIKDLFQHKLEEHVANKTKLRIEDALGYQKLTGKKIEEFNHELQNLFNNLNPESIANEVRIEYLKILNDEDFNELLKVFNYKNLVKIFSKHFEWKESEYRNYILRKLGNDSKIEKIFSKYLPILES